MCLSVVYLMRLIVQESRKNYSLLFLLQDRPEFSEVVSNLEECLCNVEV